MVIPAFAIGRTQTFMYYLRQLENEKKIPILPVYVDSPMALSATELYVKYTEDHDLDFSQLESSGDRDPLNVHVFHLTRSAEDSKAINTVKGPCIIVSASGMVTGGRVAASPGAKTAGRLKNAVLAGWIPGRRYARPCAAGRREGAAFIRAGGAGECANYHYGTFSAHAGKSELLRWLGGLEVPPKKTWLTHWRPAAAQALQAAIEEKFQWDVSVARYWTRWTSAEIK